MQTYSSSNLYLNLMTSSASEVAKIPITTRLCFIAVNAVSCIDNQCLSGFVHYTQWSVWTGTPGCIFCDQCIKTTWYLQAYECELVLAERRWNSIYSALQTIFSKNLQTTTHIDNFTASNAIRTLVIISVETTKYEQFRRHCGGIIIIIITRSPAVAVTAKRYKK